MVRYRLSDEDWAFFEENGFLGIPCWGGYVLCKPGYEPIFVDPVNPEIEHISDSELDGLVSLLGSNPE